MSEIVLSKMSALKVYQAIRKANDNIFPVVLNKNVRVPNEKEIDFLIKHDDFKIDSIDILLASKSQHRKSKLINQSFFTTTRKGIVVGVNSVIPTFLPENILIVSPAFLLAQFASTWDFASLLKLALWFGGTYATDPMYDDLLCDRKPLLELRHLQNIIGLLQNSRWNGLGELKEVAKYFACNSASPMESELYIKLALPNKMGGLGLSNLQMNKEIQLSSQACKIAGQLYAKVDFLDVKSKVVIEYDSKTYHSNPDQSQKDKCRRDALEYDGYKCFSIVTRHITYRDVFNACTKPIVKAVKGRQRISCKNFDFLQQELFRKLKYCRDL